MSQAIHSIVKVSDGILVEFVEGSCCFYSTQFLLDHRDDGCNTTFLNYDPSPATQPGLEARPDAEQSSSAQQVSATPSASETSTEI